MAGERLCIATGQVAEPLSQQELVSCGSSNQAEYATPWCMKDSAGGPMRTFTNGCHGATSFNALMYLHLFGLPTRQGGPVLAGFTVTEEFRAYPPGDPDYVYTGHSCE